jgi:hypothetical protein
MDSSADKMIFMITFTWDNYPLLDQENMPRKILCFSAVGYNDIASYDILAMFLVIFICIWRQIKWELEELSMVWGTYCIVFTRVIVIQFYPRSCNFIVVLSVL